MFSIAYAFIGQVHVFAGQVKIVSHSSCRTSALLKYFCPLIAVDRDAKPQTKQSGVQWLSGWVLDSRPMGREFKPHQRHCVVSLSKNINPSLVLVQPRKTRPFITERLLMGRKESNQSIKQTKQTNWLSTFMAY